MPIQIVFAVKCHPDVGVKLSERFPHIMEYSPLTHLLIFKRHSQPFTANAHGFLRGRFWNQVQQMIDLEREKDTSMYWGDYMELPYLTEDEDVIQRMIHDTADWYLISRYEHSGVFSSIS